MLLGSLITMFAFSCTTPLRTNEVLAQDREPFDGGDLMGNPGSFRGVAEYVLPSVVEIRVSGSNGVTNSFDFFGPRGGDDAPDEGGGLGSGVIVERSGRVFYVVTNNHVAGAAESITVVTRDGESHSGEMVGSDPRKDLAVVSFEHDDPDSIPVAPFGDSDELFVGDWVLAVGNPFGFASTVTAGIVSAKERLGPANNISDFIQTDASINQGNSGGPLVNTRGEIVGINTWITTPTGINVGLGFAIPINNAKKAISDIIAHGEVEYGWLGVEVEDVTERIASDLAYRSTDGAIIAQVFGDSPAEKGGLQPGDIVVSLDGESIRDYLHLVRTVGDLEPGAVAEFSLHRSGLLVGKAVTIGVRRSDLEIERANRNMWPGMSVLPISDEVKGALDLPRGTEGLFVSDVKTAAAPQSAGIRRGDIVLSVNGDRTKNLLDFYRIVNDTEGRVFDVEIFRRGETLTFAVRRG